MTRRKHSLIKQVIYVSRPVGFDEEILNSILTLSRFNNERNQITGALICRSDLYLQYLEGPAHKIDSVYSKIKIDGLLSDFDCAWRPAQLIVCFYEFRCMWIRQHSVHWLLRACHFTILCFGPDLRSPPLPGTGPQSPECLLRLCQILLEYGLVLDSSGREGLLLSQK